MEVAMNVYCVSIYGNIQYLHELISYVELEEEYREVGFIYGYLTTSKEFSNFPCVLSNSRVSITIMGQAEW